MLARTPTTSCTSLFDTEVAVGMPPPRQLVLPHLPCIAVFHVVLRPDHYYCSLTVETTAMASGDDGLVFACTASTTHRGRKCLLIQSIKIKIWYDHPIVKSIITSLKLESIYEDNIYYLIF